VRVNNLSYSQNHLNTIGVNQNYPKVFLKKTHFSKHLN
jgi:hypothetical protein